jgi:hypothetical protein
MKRWRKLTDEYVNTIKPNARRKIRLQWKIGKNGSNEVWAIWNKYEGCFYWNNGEDGVYMDSPSERPTHILVG